MDCLCLSEPFNIWFRSRAPRGEDESLCSQRTRKEEEVRMGDVQGMEGWLRSSSKDHQVDVKRKRSFSKEDFVSSTSRNDTMDVVEGNRVYISWDKFVTKSFLDAHFSRFGEVEFIWILTSPQSSDTLQSDKPDKSSRHVGICDEHHCTACHCLKTLWLL